MAECLGFPITLDMKRFMVSKVMLVNDMEKHECNMRKCGEGDIHFGW